MFAILSRFACHFFRTPNFGNNQSFKALTCDGKKVFAKSNLEQRFEEQILVLKIEECYISLIHLIFMHLLAMKTLCYETLDYD